MILMFIPTNLDEVCVQATHIELKGKSVHDVSSVEPVQAKEGKEKRKVKHAATRRRVMRNLHARILKSKGMKRQSVGSYILK